MKEKMISRGDLFYYDFGDRVGSVQSGERPVLSYLTVPEQEMVEEVHESTGKYPSLEQAKKIRQHREEKTLTKEIVRLLVIGERKKKTTVTLKQDEIKKYFPPEYDEQKIRTVICQLLEEWSNQNH